MKSLQVLFAPAEFEALTPAHLADASCVVFDVLRATTTMITALAAGAEAIIPVREISEAVSIYRQSPDVLLGGERHGVRITAADSGGVEFHLGNSPREYLPARVAAKRIIMTTTNGTRALRAASAAPQVAVGALVNLSACHAWLQQRRAEKIILICSGTFEETAFEDTLAAGALCDLIATHDPAYLAAFADSAHIARATYRPFAHQLTDALPLCRNGRRLLAHPDLRADAHYCFTRDRHPLAAELGPDGLVRVSL